MPTRNFYQADKYSTDNNQTLHIWADGKSDDIICPVTEGLEAKPDWLYFGKQYFDLLLTGGGGDTEKFWKDLLN